MYFNPRPREEGDTKGFFMATLKKDFNPRPREEGDYNHVAAVPGQKHFNPRPREEGDVLADFLYIDSILFQSTPS